MLKLGIFFFFLCVFFRDDFCPCDFLDGFDGKTNNVDVTEMIEGSLEVKLPTIWTVEKQR